MPVEVPVTNKQRKYAIDVAWAQRLAQNLAALALSRLRRRPPPHLEADTIADMQSRGAFSLVFVSNRQIRELNRDWRGKDKSTDVISFPLSEVPPPAGLPWEVGEVIISLEKAQEQADSLGHSFERELGFLFVHGLLHVLGFDHDTEEQEKEMFVLQKDILDEAGLRR